MATTVVELNSLSDAVGAAAEDHYFLLRRGLGLIFVLVARIHVGGEGFKFGGASVDAFEDRTDTVAGALKADGGGRGLPDLCELFVARADALHLPEKVLRSRFDSNAGSAAIGSDDFFDLVNEPWIDFREVANFFCGKAAFDGRKNPVNAIGAGRGEFLAKQRIGRFRRGTPGRAGFERADALLQRFLESAADRHHFADGLHLRAESAVCARKLFKLPLGNFHDHIVDCGLERSGSLLRDVVGDFVERHTDGKARGNLGDREAGGFAGQCGTAGDPRVHLDHHHASVFGIDGKLHVGAARFDADFTDDCGGGIAHALVFLVGEGLRWGNGDGVAGMHAHGVEILNRADDDEIVAEIAHYFEFVLFPAEDRLFHERFVDGAHVERVGNRFGKFLLVVGDRATGATEGEGRANDQRKAELIAEAQGVLRAIDQSGGWNLEADLAAGVLEPEAVFRDFDGAKRGADHLDFMLFEDA